MLNADGSFNAGQQNNQYQQQRGTLETFNASSRTGSFKPNQSGGGMYGKNINNYEIVEYESPPQQRPLEEFQSNVPTSKLVVDLKYLSLMMKPFNPKIG